jgi:hypothetical protein
MADILGMQQGIIGALGPLMGAKEQKDESQKEKDKRRAERTKTGQPPAEYPEGVVPGMRKGGRVKKTALYRVHRGERIVSKRQSHREKGRR